MPSPRKSRCNGGGMTNLYQTRYNSPVSRAFRSPLPAGHSGMSSPNIFSFTRRETAAQGRLDSEASLSGVNGFGSCVARPTNVRTPDETPRAPSRRAQKACITAGERLSENKLKVSEKSWADMKPTSLRQSIVQDVQMSNCRNTVSHFKYR